MTEAKTFWTAIGVVLAFVLLSNMTLAFDDFVYGRLGLSRDIVLTLFWLLPVIAAFLVAYRIKQWGFAKALILIPILSLVGPLAHLIIGGIGVSTDFPGISGLRATLPIYAMLSTLAVGLGAILGVGFKIAKNRSPR